MSLSANIVVRRSKFVLDVDLEVADGEVLAVTGPNGSGKTTLLRALAGLEPLLQGEVRLGDELMESTERGHCMPPHMRRTAFVFQDYRLFPHLSARANVAYGPRSHGIGRTQARATADKWLAELGLREVAAYRPHRLSGGQSQRVALARALATEPALLLLDEPLAALDATVRTPLRSLLAAQVRRSKAPCLLVTHDALEAVLLADRMLVLENGIAVQYGTCAEVSRRPATEFVATLMGLNLLDATRTGRHEVQLRSGWIMVVGTALDHLGDDLLVAVRPASVNVHTERPAHASPRNVWAATITGLDPVLDRVRLTTHAPQHVGTMLVDITVAAAADLGMQVGGIVWLSVKATELEAYAR